MPDTATPYTDADLRAEAARQHETLAEDPDFMGVGEMMEDAEITSQMPEEDEDGTTDPDAKGWTWSELLDEDQFDAAQRQIHDLINGAADTSAWAVNLGADGLEPDEHELTWPTGGQPAVRLHLAYHPELPPGARAEVRRLVDGILTDVMAGLDEDGAL